MTRYRPIDADALSEPDAHALFQLVTDHYLSCADNDWQRVDALEQVPRQVAVVWRLWLFLAEVGGEGVCDYLWNHCHRLVDLRQVHADLQEVDAAGMLAVLESAIRLTVDTSFGEYLEDAGAAAWSAQFSCANADTADELNERSMDLAYPGCSEIVATYIRVNALAF